MTMYDKREDMRVINPRPVCKANKHSMLDEQNVWIKPSTGQRICRQCARETRQKNYRRNREASKGFFRFGELWSADQVRLASLAQLRQQKEAVDKKVNQLAKDLANYQEQFKTIDSAYYEKVLEMTGGRPDKPITDND